MRGIDCFLPVLFFTLHTASAQVTSPPPPPRSLPPNAPPPTAARTLQPQPTPAFVMRAPQIRHEEPKTGYSVGVWAGANAFQGGDWHINNASVSERGEVFMSGGVKLDYTWQFSDEPIDQFHDEVGGEGLRLPGGIEGEAFWVGSKLRPVLNDIKYKLDANSAVFMLDFLLKAQAGNFRPYAGPGVGLAAIFADNYNVPGTTEKDDSDLTFAYQVLAGCDYFLDRDWSVFAEYRFLIFNDAKLYKAPVEAKLDHLDQHLFSLGVRRHF